MEALTRIRSFLGNDQADGRKAKAGSLVILWFRRMRARRELQALEDYQIVDTGLDPETVRREACKPFWMR